MTMPTIIITTFAIKFKYESCDNIGFLIQYVNMDYQFKYGN